MLKKCDVEYRERVAPEYCDRTSLFKGMTLVMTGRDAESIGDWGQLLTRLGATVYQKTKESRTTIQQFMYHLRRRSRVAGQYEK